MPPENATLARMSGNLNIVLAGVRHFQTGASAGGDEYARRLKILTESANRWGRGWGAVAIGWVGRMRP
jgi:hypothetical protein